ncbi:peptidoglycan-recognition protein LB-like [Macrosteles quadrilineatus]|uniref:peptidoglycan-recognition protein LB-like n=1 Tax=Macrosteles quadrilineatus TaxID=74068 RepID=UPI0023E327E4|nr:peptidoglycan-recognition protein LB-like [Macrosteles quadrilineatus]
MKHRDQWGALLPKRKFYLSLPVRNVIFVYHTWSVSCEKDTECYRVLKEMQNHEMKKMGGPDIKYNFLVDNKGTVYEGRGFHVMPVAPTKFFPLDDKSISIGFIGDFRDTQPNFLMWAGAIKLLAFGIHTTFIKQYFDFALCRL